MCPKHLLMSVKTKTFIHFTYLLKEVLHKLTRSQEQEIVLCHQLWLKIEADEIRKEKIMRERQK